MKSLGENILLDTLFWVKELAGSLTLWHFSVFPFLVSSVVTSVGVEGSFMLHSASPLDLSTDQGPPKAAHLIQRATQSPQVLALRFSQGFL